MEVDELRNCTTCGYSARDGLNVNGYICLRYPPAVFPALAPGGQVVGSITLSPIAAADKVCGEYKPAPPAVITN